MAERAADPAGSARGPAKPERADPGPAGSASGATAPVQTRAAAKKTPAPSEVAFSNLDKIFFPELGLTKGDVIAYYHAIAPYLLPHLKDRPLTLRRWPNGIHGEDFFQKDIQDAPQFVRTVRIWSDQGDRDVRMVVCDDETVLLWLAQMACIEMHAWFSRIAPIPGRGRVGIELVDARTRVAHRVSPDELREGRTRGD